MASLGNNNLTAIHPFAENTAVNKLLLRQSIVASYLLIEKFFN